MRKMVLALTVIFLLFGCSKKKEFPVQKITVLDGTYMGYFVYQSNKYWYEISFDKNHYEEWPSGGAMFQKSYGCLTTGSYSMVNDKLTFGAGSEKFPGFPEPCISDMSLPGEYLIQFTVSADSLIFEKGSSTNKIKYHLEKLLLE